MAYTTAMTTSQQLADIHALFAQNLPLFNALGDNTRQQLMLLIIEGFSRGQPLSVAELAAAVGLASPTVSHHLKLLHEVGLVRRTKSETKHYYQPCVGQYIDSLELLIGAIKQVAICERTS